MSLDAIGEKEFYLFVAGGLYFLTDHRFPYQTTPKKIETGKVRAPGLCASTYD